MSDIAQYYSLLLSLAIVFCFGCYWALQQKRASAKQAMECDKPVLCTEVKRYRLYRMLQFLGVNFSTYIKRLPVEEISQHIVRCRNCPNLPECDDCLRDGHAVKDMNFCPNYKRLTQLSQKLKPPSSPRSKTFFIFSL